MKNGEIFQFGEFRIDPQDRTLRRNDSAVVLHRRAFDVLLYLVQNPGRVVTKDELLKNVWPDAFVDENNLTQSISVLRKALDDRNGANSYITTLPGRGYQFVVPVKVIGQAAVLDLEPSFGNASPGAGLLVQQRTITSTSIVTEERQHGRAATKAGRMLVLLVIGSVVVVGVIAVLVRRHLHPKATSATVVVANFLNTTGDATFDRTLDRALEIDLSQSPYMDVMSEGEVVSMLQYMGLQRDAAVTADIARQVCERSNRQAVLSGSIASVGRKYLLTLEATNCNTGEQLASAKADASSKEEVLAALDSVADRVRSKLGESAKSVESYRVPIDTATTPSLEALQAYSMGDYLGSQGKDESETLPLFQRAVELDPKFAMAYGQIASDYYNLAEFDKASVYYAKAFELSEHVSAKEKLVLQAHYYAEGRHDLENGIKTYQLWTDTYPRDWAPLVNICNQYTQLGKYEPAIEAGEQAVKLQPDRGVTYSVLARALMRANRFADAENVGMQAKKRGKDSVGLHGTLFDIAFDRHDDVAISREVQWAAAHNSSWYAWSFPDSEAEGSATLGKYRQAEGLFRTAYQVATEQKAVESADSVLVERAEMELNFGLPEVARETLRGVVNQETDIPDLVILKAKLGDRMAAERYLAKYAKETDDTVMMYRSLPRVRAALATEEGRPMDAVAALERAQPYELADFTVPAQRAEDYLKARQGEMAAGEYSKILAHPGLDLSQLYVMAHLGLARAYALSGKRDASRSEYEAFLAAWKDADPDLPVLKQAKAELAALPAR
jgi:DNA-binding winged helix-turn-helix (wHTH) protein/Flp pilus assembly protein TadD/TolB-like protein